MQLILWFVHLQRIFKAVLGIWGAQISHSITLFFFFSHFGGNMQSAARAGGIEKRSELAHTWPTYGRRGTWAPIMDSSTKFGVGPEESSSLCSLNPDSSESSNRKLEKKNMVFFSSRFFFQELVSRDDKYLLGERWRGGGSGGCFLYLIEKREDNEKKSRSKARVASCCLATLLVCGDVC